jgi:esterase/lipase superfamily enzyme
LIRGVRLSLAKAAIPHDTTRREGKTVARLKRKLWLGAAVVALVLVGAGSWFYYTIYMTSDFSLRHAEAFRFRRMTVAQLAEQGTYRYFFVTNRRQQSDEGPVEERFGRDREEALKFGSFDAKIERTLGLGMLINPTEWFQNEEINLQKIQKLEEAAFVERLTALVDGSPYRSLLVVVHGYKEAFPSALRKTAFFGHILDVNSPILLFDWPGDQGSSLRGYRRAREVAEASGADLARTLKLIVQQIRPARLWIVANSLGGQVVVDAFSTLYRDADFADAETEIEEVVLTAPDVDHEQFDRQFKREITALADNLTVYVSSNDRALVMSRLINRAPRRGESTLTPDQLQEAVWVAELVDPGSDLITLVDVTPVNRTRNFHNFGLETPEFFDDLYLRLTNESAPQSRRLYRVKTTEGAEYWVLTRGR